jgi:putative tryptophan/tyrosine transport system substrate-binding protein
MVEIRRRELITLLGGAAAWPLAARAQRAAMPVIGALFAVSAAEWEDYMAGFRRGLSATGWVAERNITIEYRWAEGQFDRLPALAADLVGREVAVIFVGGDVVAIRAAMAATKTIPIVFTTGADAVTAGLVASLNRPGGNATGVTLFPTELGQKRLELLRELIPTARKVALLVNPSNPAASHQDISGVQEAARRLGMEIVVVDATADTEFESAFATAVQQGAAALLVGSDAFFVSRREQIAALALRLALPAITSVREGAVAGGLLSYGSNFVEGYRQAGIYVGRILKGETPTDLPIVQPTKFDLVVNLKTAKALGLTVSESFLLRADEVIE